MAMRIMISHRLRIHEYNSPIILQFNTRKLFEVRLEISILKCFFRGWSFVHLIKIDRRGGVVIGTLAVDLVEVFAGGIRCEILFSREIVLRTSYISSEILLQILDSRSRCDPISHTQLLPCWLQSGGVWAWTRLAPSHTAEKGMKEETILRNLGISHP
jgi:hypothetical protein